jgi:flavin-binding protein dodecin
MAARQCGPGSRVRSAVRTEPDEGGNAVSTYKVITLAGTSPQSFAKAAETAVAEASKTLRGMAWFHVKEMRGRIRDGKIAEYQVIVEIGFKLE